MSNWSSYLFRGYRQRQDHSDVVDLLETICERNSFTSNEDKKEMEDIVKRLRYRHPKTPPRRSHHVNEKDVGNDETLHLNVIDSMNNMLPSNRSSTIKIDSSSMSRGEGLLRDFGGGGTSSSKSSDSSCGISQGTDESGDVSLGTPVYTDRRNL